VVGDFRSRLEALSGTLYEARNLRDARGIAQALVAGGTVARWADPVLDGIARAEAPPEEAAWSLIVADAGVADTGAIAFAHGPGRSRAAGLLPDRQVALLWRDHLVQTMEEALLRWFAQGRPPSNVVFAAGPSRTADIEQRLLLGVHAPRSLDVILYG